MPLTFEEAHEMCSIFTLCFSLHPAMEVSGKLASEGQLREPGGVLDPKSSLWEWLSEPMLTGGQELQERGCG